MVHVGVAALAVGFQKRKIHNPQKLKPVRRQIKIITQLEPHRAQGFARRAPFIGDDQQKLVFVQVTADNLELRVRQKLSNRTFQSLLRLAKPRHAFRAVRFGVGL